MTCTSEFGRVPDLGCEGTGELGARAKHHTWQWLEAIDEFTVKIKQMQRPIEEVAAEVDELDTLMSAPGIAAFSGLMIHGEIGEVGRFDRAAEVVSYDGLDPVIRESGDSRREGQINKEGTGYLRWILVQIVR